METNNTQFPKLQLFDLEVFKQMKKGLQTNNFLFSNLLKMAVFKFDPNLWSHG